MTKAEAVSRIENIEGMTGSRALALVEALDALGLLNVVFTAQLEQVLADRNLLKPLAGASAFRDIKDSISSKGTPLNAHG